MDNEFNIGDIVQITGSGCAYTTYSEMAEEMGLTEYVYGNDTRHHPPLNSGLKIVATVQHLSKEGVTLYGVESVSTGEQYIISNEYGNMALAKPTTQYTLDDLRNKYVHVGTLEYEVFMDTCEWLGITWLGGIPCRSFPYDFTLCKYVGLNSKGNLSWDCFEAAYGSGYSKFVPKQPQPDTIVEETPWTIYNNTLPMYDLTDEQAVELFLAGKNGRAMEYCIDGEWYDKQNFNFVANGVYRVKPKGELDEFVDKVLEVTNYKGNYGDNDVAYIARILYDNGCRFV